MGIKNDLPKLPSWKVCFGAVVIDDSSMVFCIPMSRLRNEWNKSVRYGEIQKFTRISAASTFRNKSRLWPDSLHRLLIAFPVNCCDGCSAFQLQVTLLKVLVTNFEPQTQNTSLKARFVNNNLKKNSKYSILHNNKDSTHT